MKYLGISIVTDDLTLGDTDWFRAHEKRLGAHRRAWPYWSKELAPLTPVVTALPPTKGISAIKFAWATAPLLRIMDDRLLERLLNVGFGEFFWFGPILRKTKRIPWSYYIPKPPAQIPVYYDKIKRGTAFDGLFGAAPGVDFIAKSELLPLLEGFRDPELAVMALPNLG